MATPILRQLTVTIFSIAAAILIIAASNADADVLSVGAEFQVNTYTTNIQGYVRAMTVSRAPSGDFVVVWRSDDQDGDEYGVFGQRYDSTGVPDGTEFAVNTYTTNSQGYRTDVSSAADGSFVVVWSSYGQDGDSISVHGQRFDATGAPDGTEFQVNTYTTNVQGNYAIVASSAPDGAFVVVWNSRDQDGDKAGVFGQRFDSTGVPDGTEFPVNTYTTSYQGDRISVSSASDGSFVVAWTSGAQDGSDYGVFAQRYDSAGAADGTEFQVNSYTTNSQGYNGDLSVSSTPGGSFVVAWDSYDQDGSSTGVFVQRFDSAGAPDGSEFQVNTYTTSGQYRPKVASDADGSFVVAWDSYGSSGTDTSKNSVQAQRYDSTGAADGSQFQVNTYTTNAQGYPELSIASDGTGEFVVVWTSQSQDGSFYGVFGQRLCTDADTDGNCDTRCSLVPATGCNAAAQAKLDVNEKKAGKEKTKLQWKKLADATVQVDFGDPVAGTTAVALCIYDDANTLVQEYIVDRATEQCAGKDCWKAKGTKGYGYKDKDTSADGISKIGLKAGDATKGKTDAQGKNNQPKGQMSLPINVVAKLTGATAPTIQMVTSDGFCSTATMNTVKKDEATRYSAQLK